MLRRHAALPGWIGAMLAVMLVLAGCSRSSPEQQLRDQFAALQQAVEERQPAEAMDGVAEDFSGPAGMDRAALHNLLRAQLLARDSIGVTTGPLEVSLQGDTATIRFDALLTGSGRGRWLPDSAQSYRVTTGWRRDGDDWRLYYAEWQAGP
ncbi:nuclear transport factor 2 family protein [Pseudoxanthomonas sp. 22568]|uniref:nuclear transport factor 2 family protein n=1 Tax=Pseudoxanthomonas sp. 22568 TaxID=3453945 RepID=UPI003F8544A5